MPEPEHPPKPESLDRLLDRWAEAPPAAPGSVTPEVWRQIKQAERADRGPVLGWGARIRAVLARPSFAAVFVVACVLLGLLLSEVRSSRRQAGYSAELARNYIRLIDPLLGATEASQRTESADGLTAQLGWMKENLRLTDEQVARLRALHEQSTPRLIELAAQVASMRGELAAFERERTTSGRIDFLEFARFVEQRRALDHACLDSTRTLVAASAGVMTPQQREHYLSLLGPTLRSERTNAIP